MSDAARGPVGVFDSGIGGLSIVRMLQQRLPQQDVLYVADQAHCPYGERPQSSVRRFSQGIARFLMDRGAQVIVVACNTASATALTSLRRQFPRARFVGMVPAIKPAAEITRTGVVGVLATPLTLHGRLYDEVVHRYARDVRVVSEVCLGLVERIELGDFDGPDTEELVQSCLAPLLAAGADVLVLGCTHYPFLMPLLRRLLPDSVRVIEPSDAIARQTQRVLAETGQLAPLLHTGRTTYATSGDLQSFEKSFEGLGCRPGDVVGLRWRDGRLVEAEEY